MESDGKPRTMLRAARVTGGVLLVLAGIVGLVMPIMPGWLLIIPGLSLLATEFAWASRLRHRARQELRRRRAEMDRRRRDSRAL